jgi:hypothetical protein
VEVYVDFAGKVRRCLEADICDRQISERLFCPYFANDDISLVFNSLLFNNQLRSRTNPVDPTEEAEPSSKSISDLLAKKTTSPDILLLCNEYIAKYKASMSSLIDKTARDIAKKLR